MASKLAILIETLYKGAGAQKAAKDMGALGKATQKSSMLQAAHKARSADLSKVMNQLATDVSKGTISVGQATKDFEAYKKALPVLEVEETTKKTGEMGLSMGKIAIAAGAAAAAFVIAKKAFDLGAEGAKIRQLRESFDRMNESVFKTPGLLMEMKKATHDTVSETQLMSGLLTLTAGASENLASKLAEAAPKLAEIAKAANKLNPTLGDTGFMFESIATGVKRASPMILDNLGIMVKVGDANEAYAEQIGKTVESLSAEEKQLALLNEVMRSGGNLIKQVGGDVGSAGDKFQEASVNIANLTDDMKVLIAEGIGPLVGAFADLTKGMREQGARAETRKELRALGKTVGFTSMEFKRLETGLGSAVRAQRAHGKWTVSNTEDNKLLALALDISQAGFIGGEKALAKFTVTMHNAAVEQDNLQRIHAMEAERVEEVEDALVFEIKARQTLTNAYSDQIKITGAVTGAYDDQTRAAEGTTWAMGVYGDSLPDSTKAAEEHAKALADLEAALKAARGAFGGATVSNLDALVSAEAEGTTVTNDFHDALFRAAAAAGAPTSALQGLADMTENYTDAQIRAALRTAATQTKIQDLAQDVADGVITWIEAKDELNNYIDGLDRVPTEVHTDFTWDFKGPPSPDFYRQPNTVGPPRIGGPQAQHGLDMIVPPGHNNDRYPIWTSSGERVIVQTKEQQKAGGGGNTVNVYLQGGSGNALVDGHRLAGIIADRLGARG